jgi:hypothetical protein
MSGMIKWVFDLVVSWLAKDKIDQAAAQAYRLRDQQAKESRKAAADEAHQIRMRVDNDLGDDESRIMQHDKYSRD